MNAKEMNLAARRMAKAFTIAAVSVLALGVGPAANAQVQACSSATLKGDYVFKGAGAIVSAPEAAVIGPTAGVNTLTFDGYGRLTAGAGYMSLNGNIVPITETGSYQVNADCTGTYEALISPLGFTAHYFFVTNDSGNELQIICTDPGVAFTGTARRRFPAVD